MKGFRVQGCRVPKPFTPSTPTAAIRYWERTSEDIDWRRLVPELGGPLQGFNASAGQSLCEDCCRGRILRWLP